MFHKNILWCWKGYWKKIVSNDRIFKQIGKKRLKKYTNKTWAAQTVSRFCLQIEETAGTAPLYLCGYSCRLQPHKYNIFNTSSVKIIRAKCGWDAAFLFSFPFFFSRQMIEIKKKKSKSRFSQQTFAPWPSLFRQGFWRNIVFILDD